VRLRLRAWGCAAAISVFLCASARLLLASLYALEDSSRGVARAIGWAPGDALLHQRSASLSRAAERRDRVRTELETAVRLNPRLTTARLILAGELESSGDLGRAEGLLLETAHLDRQFEPRWALANFYFRREDKQKFERWLESAGEMAHDGARPLFALAWRAGLPLEFITTRVVRGRPALATSLLAYSVETRNIDWTLGAVPGARDAGLLVSAVEMLLYAGRIDEAAKIWGRIPGRPAATGQGFDWRLLPDSVARVSATGELRIDSSSATMPSCDLASRICQVRPGSQARIGIAMPVRSTTSGFRWTVSSWPALKVLAEMPLEDLLSFEVPRDVEAVRLLLSYGRAAGEVRFNGVLTISSVRLEAKIRRRAPEKVGLGKFGGDVQAGQTGHERSN
jgi:hypothetical protein